MNRLSKAHPARRAIQLLSIAAIIGSGPAWAQSGADVEAAGRHAEAIQRMEQNRQNYEREEIRRRSERIDGTNTEAMSPEIRLKGNRNECQHVRRIEFQGADSLSASGREKVEDAFEGRCLYTADLEKLLVEVTRYYLDEGKISTRAYYPSQDLSRGILEVLVVEGRVESLQVEDGGADSVSLFNSFPGVEGEVLNLRDLEQGIDQLNRLPSNDARIEIAPGDASGTSKVLIRNKPRQLLHGRFDLDNMGAEATGREQAGVAVAADNLLGLNESITFSGRQSVPRHSSRQESRTHSLGLNIPFGYTNFSAGTSRSTYASTVTVPSGLDLIANGFNTSEYLRLDRVVYRDHSSRAAVSAMLTSKRSRNYLDTQYLEVSSRDLTVLDVDVSYRTAVGRGSLALGAGYAKGLRYLGAMRDQDNLLWLSPRAQFGKIKANIGYSRAFRVGSYDLGFATQIVAQKADDPLYGSEQISIGGNYSVRGFVDNYLSGDHGYYWRSEVSVGRPFVMAGRNAATRLYFGYDTGEVSSFSNSVPDGHLAGVVLGGSVNWSNASFELSHSRPVSTPDSMVPEGGKTWVRLSFAF